MKLVGMKTSKFLMCGMAAVDVNSQIAKNGKSWRQLHIGSRTGRNQVKKTFTNFTTTAAAIFTN